MTEWNKLKVPDLRAELKKRGLLQTGLKAELVARLTSADHESGFESETTVKGDTVDAGVESISPTGETKFTTTESQSELIPLDPQTLPTPKETPILESTGETSASVTEKETSNTQLNPAYNQTAKILQLSEPEDGAQSSLPVVATEELVEDKQKRKRRSQSPPQSEEDARRKRLRPDDDMDATTMEPNAPKQHVVTSKSNADGVEEHIIPDSAISTEATKISPDFATTELGHIIVDVASKDQVEPAPNIKGEGIDDDRREGEGSINVGRHHDKPSSTLLIDEDFSTKTKDSRFKGLFANQAVKSGQDTTTDWPGRNVPQETTDAEAMDRHVSPSIHPATAALYIRDFMRPLNAASLKEHLTNLATAPGTTPDSDTITDFYIDPIRTHAFILFKSTSAASRVRSELHNRIWPNERNRKPLWADFVPSEKVREWIMEEQAFSGGSRSAGKKWEVAYDINEDAIVTTTLREVGSFTAPARKPPPTIAPPVPALSRPGIEGAPSGPRAQHNNGQRTAPNRPTLDALFKYTASKPALYYQPVSRELAEKRLDHLEDATSKQYLSRAPVADIHRYTFEDGDVLVDRGPEIFSGIRPPPGYRGRGGGGGGRGGFRGRGGDRYEGGNRRDAWDLRERERDRGRERDRDRRY